MKALRLLVAVAFAVAVGQVFATLSAKAQDAPAAMSGGWKLNLELSTNPNGPEAAGSSGGGGRGGRSNTGGRTGGEVGGGDLGREELQRFNVHLAMFRKAPELLGIQATAKDVLLIYDPDPSKGLTYKYTTDNKKAKMPTPAGELEVKVKWDGKKLRREVDSKESLKVIEVYEVSADGKQLTVTVDISNIMVRVPKVDIKRVYDRVQ